MSISKMSLHHGHCEILALPTVPIAILRSVQFPMQPVVYFIYGGDENGLRYMFSMEIFCIGEICAIAFAKHALLKNDCIFVVYLISGRVGFVLT